MTVTSGRHALTQADGDLLIHTTCEGPAARLGHDLTLIVQRWEATIDIGDQPADCRLDVTAGLDSLAVRDSRGGAKAMSDSDRRDIERNAAKSLHVAKHPVLRFVSTGITGSWHEGEITGDLTLNGRTHEECFQVVALNGDYRLGGELKQSRYGIKPYSAMVGALRLADAALIEVTVRLPQS
ncbi:YceI family protein [Granulicoccus sp. GXG6511]|uniref:YceI family protein n=1 Tax=Granulicoccus sp. GXG6511 TaxID=3381351 RepID=UPI003D7C5B4B